MRKNFIYYMIFTISFLLPSINVSCQNIDEIKSKCWYILDEYGKDVVCFPDDIKSSISIDRTYKIFIRDIEVDENIFTAMADLSVQCHSIKEIIPRSKGNSGGRRYNDPYKKSIPMKVIGKIINDNIIISELYLKTTGEYNRIFPQFQF